MTSEDRELLDSWDHLLKALARHCNACEAAGVSVATLLAVGTGDQYTNLAGYGLSLPPIQQSMGVLLPQDLN